MSEEQKEQVPAPLKAPSLKDINNMIVLNDDGVLTTTSGLGVLPSFWGIDSVSISAVKTAVSVSNTRHGLMAAVPIICRGEDCPYAESCYIDSTVRNVVANKQGRCPIEIATIVDRFEMYCNHFSIKDREEDAVDMGMVRDLVDIEIQILRCDNKIAIDGDFIEDVIAGISNQGVPYNNPQLHLAWVQKEKLRNERYKVFKLLDSTRSDKAKKDMATNDASKKAVDLVSRALALQKAGLLKPLPMVTIDVTPVVTSDDKPEEVISKSEKESSSDGITPTYTSLPQEDNEPCFEIEYSQVDFDL